MKKSVLLTALIAILLLLFGKSFSQSRITSPGEVTNRATTRFTMKQVTSDGIVGVNSATRYFASGQGISVKATGTAPVLQATQVEWEQSQAYTNLIRITMSKGAVKDEAIIHFRADATSGFDSNADALKLSGSQVNVSTLDDSNDNLAINSLPLFDCGAEVRMDIAHPAAATYKFDFTEYSSFDAQVAIALVDAFTGTTFDVRSGSSYAFTVTTAPATYGSGRFKMTFTVVNPIGDFTLAAPAKICGGTSTQINLSGAQSDVTYELSANNTPITSLTGSSATLSFDVLAAMFTGAENHFTVTATKHCAVLTKEITIEVPADVEVSSVQSGKHCQAGAVTLTAEGAPADGTYNWYETEAAETAIADQHGPSFTTPVLSASKTYYVAIANNLGCEGARVPVEAAIIVYENIAIVQDGDSLRSNYSGAQQWYFNAEEISGATRAAVKPTQTGVYKVEADIQGCSTSAEKSYEIILSVEQQDLNGLLVYPNPVAGQLRIEIPDTDKNIKSVQVLDASGRPIGTFQFHREGTKRVGKFELTHYPAGIYIVHAQGSVRSMEKRVVKK